MNLSAVRFGTQIAAAAEAHHLDPKLLAAVAAQETGGPGATSGANIVGDGGHGHGLFQIDDRYHAFAQTSAAMDPAKNADYAASMLSGLIQRYGVHGGLSAYNAGSPSATGTVTNWGGTQLGYADSVMAHYAQLGGGTLPEELAAQAPDDAAASGGLANAAAAMVANASAGLGPGGATTAPAASGPLSVPQLQLPAPDPNNWQFRSYQSDLQNGGGQIASSDDKLMASFIAPPADGKSGDDGP